jgi:hypothetical protein
MPGAPEELTDPRWDLRPGSKRPIAIVHSGPKFQHLETATAASNASLTVQNGTRTLQLDCQRDDYHQGQSGHQKYTGSQDIAEPRYQIRDASPLNGSIGLPDVSDLRHADPLSAVRPESRTIL